MCFGLSGFIKSVLFYNCRRGDDLEMKAKSKCPPKEMMKNRLHKLGNEVSVDIPPTVEISRRGQSVIMESNGVVYPVTRSVLKPFVREVVKSDRTVTIKTNGLSLPQINDIADFMKKNDDTNSGATIEIKINRDRETSKLISGEINIKGGKK